MSTPRLIFHPHEPQLQIPVELLLQRLRELGFIAEALPSLPGDSYAVGERFLELLTFLGCSPVIQLSAADGDKYCYIELLQLEAPQLLQGSQPFQPRCKACRQPLDDWQHRLAADATLSCPHCQHSMSLQQVNWKQSAGYASQFIVVHNIFLHEAVPGEALLLALEGLADGASWKYFYAL